MITHLVFDGVADGPLGVALDVVGTAARLLRAGLAPSGLGPEALAQRILSMDGAAVTTQAGRPLAVDGAFKPEGLGPGDWLVLAGLGAATPLQVDALLARPDVVAGVAALPLAAAQGCTLAASCSATFVLAAAGLLDGRQATTTWWLTPTFAQRFPRVALRSDRMVVASHGVFTAGSAFAHADLLLALVAHHLGPSLAHLVAKYLVLDARPSQASYMVVEHLKSSEPLLRELEAFVLARLQQQCSLQDMAAATATSPRTLARRVRAALGITPQHFAQRLRVAQAIHLLETTQEPIEAIAAQVGYADAAAFRRTFRRHTGAMPSARRQR